MPSAYTHAISLPTYDNARGLAIAGSFTNANRFWMRARHDAAGSTAETRWKAWAELWTNANFDPGAKLDRAGGTVNGTLLFESSSVFRFMAKTPTFFQGPDGAGDNVISFTRNGKTDYTMNVFGSLTVGGERVWHTGNFAPNTKANRIPGQVIMFAGKNAPAGTLLCNGAAVSRTTYAELFAAIGTLYGAGDGSTTFNLPAMLEGTVVTHTQKPETVGTSTAGEVLKHTHGASSAAAGSHSHGASTGAAGDHAHTGWTDQQGHHAHTGSTNAAGDHQHGGVVPSSPAFVGYGVYREIDNDAMYSEGSTGSAGNHTHSFSTDGAGGHTHSVGMNGSGNHTHTVSVGQAGEHSHAVTVSSSGGDRNLPAGLRMIYCIVH
ncbi:tail fiber protein [Stenotrophomonas maltophilia]|nr:tail fiber protein [Stenotrophomonas maltophilia]